MLSKSTNRPKAAPDLDKELPLEPLDSKVIGERYRDVAGFISIKSPIHAPFSGQAAALLAADVNLSEANTDSAASSLIWRNGQVPNQIEASKVADALWSERESLLQRNSQWFAITSPKTELLSGLSHPLAAQQSPENLLPHTTAWAQSIYLAVTFRLQQLHSWASEEHPEWLDEEGHLNPFSMAGSDNEADNDAQTRAWLLAELAFLRDLGKHSQLFIEHRLSGKPFFQFRGLGTDLTITEDFTQSQTQHWQRTDAGEARLFRTKVPGDPSKLDERQYTLQAQILCWAADLKNVAMEQAIYTDAKGDEERQLVMFKSLWITPERLILIDRLLSRYVAEGGLDADQQAYAALLNEVGEKDAEIKAAEEFKRRVEPALAQSTVIVQNLAHALVGRPISDIARVYLLKSRPGNSVVIPARNQTTEMERFGLSIDPSRIEAGLAQALSRLVDVGSRLSLTRGYQPNLLKEIQKTVAQNGHPTNEFGGIAGLTVADKIELQQREMKSLLQKNEARERDSANARVATDNLQSQQAELQRYAEKMERWAESAREQNQELRRMVFEKRVMIGVLCDLLTEARVLFNQQAADFMGERMAPVEYDSHLAEVLISEGVEVDPEAMKIRGIPTSDESFGRMEAQRQQQVDALLHKMASKGILSREFADNATPAAKGIIEDMRSGSGKKQGFFKGLFTGGDEELEAGPRYF